MRRHRRKLVHVQGYSRRFPRLGDDAGVSHAITTTSTPADAYTGDPTKGRLYAGGPLAPGSSPDPIVVRNLPPEDKSSDGWVWLLFALALTSAQKRR